MCFYGAYCNYIISFLSFNYFPWNSRTFTFASPCRNNRDRYNYARVRKNFSVRPNVTLVRLRILTQMEEDLKKSKTSPGVAKQIPMLHFVDARHADLLEPDRDLSCKMEVSQEDSIKCDSLESNFCSLGEDPGSAKSSELNLEGSEDVDDVEILQSDVDNPASLGLPIVVGNSQWYVRRFSPQARQLRNLSDEFSFVGDNSVGSYSVLGDSRPTRDVDSLGFSFMAAGGSRCNLAGMRRMKEMGEEDGFVVL